MDSSQSYLAGFKGFKVQSQLIQSFLEEKKKKQGKLSSKRFIN
jgi:hypothetical protein